MHIAGAGILNKYIYCYKMRKRTLLKVVLGIAFCSFQMVKASTAENVVEVKATMDTNLYFNEVDGLVVAEIESLLPAEGWVEKSDREGFMGMSFFEWTSSDLFNTPGRGVLNYIVKINNPGVYRFEWRCKVGHGSSATEANDSWFKIPDADRFYAVEFSSNDTVRPKGVCSTDCPEGSGKDGWFKLYSTGVTTWTWSGKTYDRHPHEIHAEFNNPGFYTIQISGRSKHHLLDRFVLYNKLVSDPKNLEHKESKISYRSTDSVKVRLKADSAISNQGIEGANFDMLGETNRADGSGYAFFYHVPADSLLPVEVSQLGYYSLLDTIKVSSDTTIIFNLNELPDTVSSLTFSLSDENSVVVKDAQVKLGDDVQLSDTFGSVVFTNLLKETLFTYEIEKSGYLPVSGELTLIEDTVVKITLVEDPNKVGTTRLINNKEFVVMPNPVSNIMHINTEKLIQGFEIIDMNGKVILSDSNVGLNNYAIDLSSVDSGFYIIAVHYKNDSRYYAQKFLKE